MAPTKRAGAKDTATRAPIMERAAYWAAFGTVIISPPFLLIWLLIHPFTRFWRKLGPAPTYLAITPVLPRHAPTR